MAAVGTECKAAMEEKKNLTPISFVIHLHNPVSNYNPAT